MAKKFIWILLAVTVAISLALAGCATEPASPEEVYEFTFAYHGPPDSRGEQIQVMHFVDKVEELSNGQIEIEVISGGQLGNIKQELGLVQSGTVDMTQIVHLFYAGELPLLSYDNVPFLCKSISQRLALHAYMDENVPELKASWAEYNQIPVARWAQTPDVLSSNEPIRTPADMEGLKIRTGGGIQPLILEALGAVGVSLASGETYLALQTGVVDGTYQPGTLVEMYKWYEASPNITIFSPEMSNTVGSITMNLDRWNSLPQSIKDIFMQASGAADLYAAEVWDEVEKESYANMADLGVNVIYLTEAETQKFKDATNGAEAEWIKLNPELKELIDMAKAWLAEHPE